MFFPMNSFPSSIASYETGIEWFNKGVELDEIPENYKNNEYFMNGYNSCNGRSK